MLQTVTHVVSTFCKSADDNSIPLAGQKELLLRAATAHVNVTTRVARSHGLKAHMQCLLTMLEEGEEIPRLFIDKVKTDCLEGLFAQEVAFLTPRPECFFLHYELLDERYVLGLFTEGLSKR